MNAKPWENMTLRDHLVAATMPRATKGEMRQHICAAIGHLNGCGEPGRWWTKGQGVSCADYRVRIVADPRPGEPDPFTGASSGAC
jgi:hypothetical protein